MPLHFKQLFILMFILNWMSYIKGETLIPSEIYKLDMIDLLGLDNPPKRLTRQISMDSSASKFLIEAYHIVNGDMPEMIVKREKRSMDMNLNDQHFLTDFDRWEIEQCNNIITFSSRQSARSNDVIQMEMSIIFNTNYVDTDLKLVHSILRLYQQPNLGKYQQKNYRAWLTIYQRLQSGTLKSITSLNTTTNYEGWLAFGATEILGKWLKQQQKSLTSKSQHQIYVGAVLAVEFMPGKYQIQKISPIDLGVIQPNASTNLIELEPFMVGYFNGPELWQKMHKLRFKRDLHNNNNNNNNNNYNDNNDNNNMEMSALQPIKSNLCQLINLSFDLDAYLKNDLIEPKIINVYFCGGTCDFPLTGHLNATNHAIIQTLMHLKNPTMPKVKCVPTILGSISILHYVNEDSVRLSKFHNMIAKACGCH